MGNYKGFIWMNYYKEKYLIKLIDSFFTIKKPESNFAKIEYLLEIEKNNSDIFYNIYQPTENI